MRRYLSSKKGSVNANAKSNGIMNLEAILNRLLLLRKLAIVVFVLFLMSARPAVAQYGEFECTPLSTSEYSTEKSSGTACFVVNSCDLPDTRIGYLYDTTESITWIRVKFHVVAEDDSSNPASTELIVQSQMDQLNADFAPYGIQFMWDMRFVYASWARIVSAPSYFNTIELRSTFFEEKQRQLNIVATELIDQGFSWASNPQLFEPYGDSGGIAMSTNPQWNQFTAILTRHTLTHEFGHIFGLIHTYAGQTEWVNPGTNCFSPCAENLWTGAGDENGDYCSDTPPQPPWGNSTFAGAGNDPCSGLPWPPIPNTNFMNVASTSKDDFSPLQVARMKCYIENLMNLWIAGVRIKSGTRYGQAPLAVQFTSEEHDSVSSWLWGFGDSTTSTAQNPQHTYTEPGLYTVELTGVGDSTYNAVNNSFVAVHADTIHAFRTETFQSDIVEVSISARNYLPTASFQIPITYSGPVEMELLDVSTTALRTTSGSVSIIHHDTASKQLTIEISKGSSYFLADTGRIVKIRFIVPPGELDSTLLDFAPYSSYEPKIETYYGSHIPTVNSSYLIRNSCCLGTHGDLNGDGNDANILDLTFAVDFIFRGSGDNGNCYLESDVNQDGGVLNILDLTYLVDFIFRGGSAPPVCM